MLSLITFDLDTYSLDIARLSTMTVSFVILRLMFLAFRHRKQTLGSYYSPVMIFTTFWLTVLFCTATVLLVSNAPQASRGAWFVLLSAAYVWSLAGLGWLLAITIKRYNLLIEYGVAKIMTDVQSTLDKADQ